MESHNSNYSKLYYSLVAASIGGIVIGGYMTLSSLFSSANSKDRQLEKAKINTPLNESHSSAIFMKELSALKNKFTNNNEVNLDFILPEEDTIKIISLIKEYADFLFEQRNKEYLYERRKLFASLLKSDPNSNEYNVLNKKYLEICGREYFDLYNFALNNSKTYVMKHIKLRRRFLEESWEKFSQKDEIYYKINYYSNIFNNFYYDENDPQHKFEFITKLFEEFSHLLIFEVTKLENELNSVNIAPEERDERYAEGLQLLKLKLSDEIFVKYKMDDNMLKYLAITIHQIHKVDDKYKTLLEKVNGIHLISIGL